jgi:hypothetical protein
MRVATITVLPVIMVLGGSLASSSLATGRMPYPSTSALLSEDLSELRPAARNPKSLASMQLSAKALRRCRTLPIECNLKS